MSHEHFMRRAMALARKGKGKVEPNPMVGAVLVAADRVVGEGYHRYFGGPHAEVEAIRHAGAKSHGATLYVTLEPCVHHGKTPPCTELILRSGIRTVVAATKDSNPLVNGKGLMTLRRAGVRVIRGVLEREARRLNRSISARRRPVHPYVTAKWAMSLDGKIASSSGDSKWISSPGSRAWARTLRRDCQAVVVGIGTVLADDPMLMRFDCAHRPEPVEGWKPSARRNPIRVVLDRRARIPLRAQLVRTARQAATWVVVSRGAPRAKVEQLQRAGCRVVVQTSAGIRDAFRHLGMAGCSRVLIEGGGAVLGSAFDAGMVDEVCVVVSPVVIGGTGAVSAVGGRGVQKIKSAWRLRDVRIRRFGTDVLIRGRVK